MNSSNNQDDNWADRVLSEIDPSQLDEAIKLGAIPGLSADEAAKALTDFFAQIPDDWLIFWDQVMEEKLNARSKNDR